MAEGMRRFQVIIVGAGSAGISVAARLRRRQPRLSVAILDPSKNHYYQPLWTLVGGGAATKESTVRSQRELIPHGVTWIPKAVGAFQTESNSLLTTDGDEYGYDMLVVTPGLQVDWAGVAGLPEALQDPKCAVSSNYSFETVANTWELIRNFKGGTALFTQPNTPVKCAGAPQKIMYLADDSFRKQGVRDQSRVVFASGMGEIFAVEKYARSLNQVIARKKIETLFQHNLVEVRGASREAVFENLQTKERVVLPYDMLHATPPMSAPDFIKKSPLANASGWVDVNKETLQHVRFKNIFSAGDAASLPTSKTGAAIRKQVPVLVENLLDVMAGLEPSEKYDGYTSCPLVTGYGKLILAEFDYDKKPQETFPFDQSKERLSMYLLKKHMLPKLYWDGMLRGRA